jgi:pilus assembly protein Flp/PilA
MLWTSRSFAVSSRRHTVFLPPIFTHFYKPSAKLSPGSIIVGPNNREKSMSVFSRFLRDEKGATAIEYGLIAAGISVVIITAVNAVGTQLINIFNTVSADLAKAGNK